MNEAKMLAELKRQEAIAVADELLGLETWWRNSYRCICGSEWEDDWTAQCDDDCPDCGTTISPHSSIEIDGQGGEILLP